MTTRVCNPGGTRQKVFGEINAVKPWVKVEILIKFKTGEHLINCIYYKGIAIHQYVSLSTTEGVEFAGLFTLTHFRSGKRIMSVRRKTDAMKIARDLADRFDFTVTDQRLMKNKAMLEYVRHNYTIKALKEI